MKKKVLAIASFITIVSMAVLPATGAGVEKLKYGVAVRLTTAYYLPFLAAQEQGYWKANGFDAEYVPLRGGGALAAAIAAGHVNIGFSMSASVIQAAAGGLPVVMITNVYPRQSWYMWAKTGSRFKKVEDLKGAKIGIHRFGTASHAYARMALKAVGLEGKAKFVSTGGVRETAAAVKAGAVDTAGGYSFFVFGKLGAGRHVRAISRISDYFPTPWVDHVAQTTKAFARSNPDSVRRAVRAIVQGMQFATNNPRWSMDKMKMKAWHGYSESLIRLVMEKEGIKFSKDGRFDRRAVENVRGVLIEYGIVTKEKVPSVDELSTNRFVE